MKMKEKPILFNTEMVKAVLEGRKTQTRRVIKPQPFNKNPGVEWGWAWLKSKKVWFSGVTLKQMLSKHGLLHEERCPYGKPGDQLWVRETFTEASFSEIIRTNEWEWKDLPNQRNEKGILERDSKCVLYKDVNLPSPIGKWKPSIFMPRKASRIQLEITDIRVERVQDITGWGVKAEGINSSITISCEKTAKIFWGKWIELWDSINANRKDKQGNILPYSWNDNPWVWVVEFKVVK